MHNHDCFVFPHNADCEPQKNSDEEKVNVIGYHVQARHPIANQLNDRCQNFTMSTAFMFCMTDPLFDGEGELLFPLNRAGRFRCDVICDAVDAFDLVNNAGRGFAKEFVAKRIIICGHAIHGCHSA